MARIRLARFAVPLLAAVLAGTPVAGQTVEEAVSRYVGENAEGFLQPLADVLGAGMASGWASSADIRPGFHVKLSMSVVGTPISDDSRVFQATTTNFSPQTTTEAPTIFGDAAALTIPGVGGTEYVFPGGLDISTMGVVAPQLTIGTIAGTEAMIRWAAYDDTGDDEDDGIGEISLLGIGARHDIDQYFPALPVELTAGFFYQSFDIGDVVSSTSTIAMVHASQSFGGLTVFGGVGYETSSTDISFTQEGSTELINVEMDGANAVRATAGVGLNLFIFGIYADYTLASQNAFTLGVELGR